MDEYHIERTRLLPSQKKAAKKEAGEIAHQQFAQNNGSGIEFREPCDCGEIVTIVRDCGQFFFREDTTGVPGCPPLWEELSEEKAVNLIEELATDGYEFAPY